MNHEDSDKLKGLLKQAMQPVDQQLRRDLWPQMLGRMHERSASVPWFDWALLAALALWLCFMPGAIPVLLYHL